MHFQVTASSRLHFGLMQIDPSQPHCYSGLGVMIAEPTVCLSVAPAANFEVLGTNTSVTERITATIRQACDYFGLIDLPDLQFALTQCPRLHSGLGVGTQLGCLAATSVAASTLMTQGHSLHTGSVCNLWEQISLLEDSTPFENLSKASGRGKRSHIGLTGFLRGGWIVDDGINNKDLHPRTTCIAFPSDWMIILVEQRLQEGLSGTSEQQSFDQAITKRSPAPETMRRLANEQITPALQRTDFDTFATAITLYNELAGSLFETPHELSALQRKTQHVRECLRNAGFSAYGQSSWGPTVWAIEPRNACLTEKVCLLEKLLHSDTLSDYDIRVTHAAPTGARIIYTTHN